MKEKIGFIGLGLMGAPMAERLMKAGYQLLVYNRTKEKADALIEQGATWYSTPASVASQAKIIFSMVSTPSVLEEITIGMNGILSGLTKGSIHIDCSTVSPEITIRLLDQYKTKGCHFLHSPVLGGVSQVIDGSLLLFVGGNEEAFRQVEHILRILSSKIWRFEQIEQAAITKLLCNSFIASMVVTLAQALVLARKKDINAKTILEILSHSHLNAPIYQTKGNAIIERNFTPRFFIEHLFKDINLMIDASKSFNSPLPITETVQPLFAKAMELGLAKEDYSAIVKIFEAVAGVEVK